MPPNPNNQSPRKDSRTGRIVKSLSLDESVDVCHSSSTETIPEKKKSVSSLVDELLSEIYGKTELKRRQSLTTGEWSWQESDQRNRSNPRFRSNLKQIEAKCHSKDVQMLREEISALEGLIADESNNLVKYLKRKDYLIARREAHYDVITAVIHAISRKTRDDMKMKFSLTPGTETGFSQWLDAMKMVAQLPGGVPSEFRTKLWLQLSERHLSEQNIDWEKAEAIIFNEWTNPDDEELGVQIVKDLHRTGCSLFCGAQEQNQALLKRVLLAYARWNKNVGYCQGFNMLAALILQVMDRDEKNAVKVMIYLIEGVLPESYFANNLRGLSVDMAVFRDLLRLRLPKLSKHLEALQNDTNSGTSYEPPLTNVFTMQWFLTLFSNCLPQQTVLRVWDLVFLHGNEVLLRTALAIWGILQDRIMSVESADEFYSIMGVVTREMLEFGLMDANNLIKMIVMVDPFPNELQELREKYLYNISPWTQSVQSAARKGIKLFYSDPEDQDDTEDEDKIALATAYGVFRRRVIGSRDVQPMGPTLDISILKQQYAKLRQRQRQAHIIISAACSSSIPANLSSVPTVSVNHLLMGKSALVNKGRRIGPPEGSIPPPKNRTVKGSERAKESGKREKFVISGETLDWKDAEKRKCSTRESKKLSNTDGKLAINKPKTKSMRSCNGLNENGGPFEEEEKDVERKRQNSTSSASSTSTELCDDEINHLSDFDVEEVNVGSETQLLKNNPPSETFKYEEIREYASELVRDIEEAINRSPRLSHMKNHIVSDNDKREAEDEMNLLSTSSHDNIILKSPEEFLKTEPEVPIAGNVIDNAENRIFDRSKEESEEMTLGRDPETKGGCEKGRRKSDLALSVIKENLEMLSKFSQKTTMKEERNEDGGGEVVVKSASMMRPIEQEKEVEEESESAAKVREKSENDMKEEEKQMTERVTEDVHIWERIRTKRAKDKEKENRMRRRTLEVKPEEERQVTRQPIIGIQEMEDDVLNRVAPSDIQVLENEGSRIESKFEDKRGVLVDAQRMEDGLRNDTSLNWEGNMSMREVVRDVHGREEREKGEIHEIRWDKERPEREDQEKRKKDETKTKGHERPMTEFGKEIHRKEELMRSERLEIEREENRDVMREVQVKVLKENRTTSNSKQKEEGPLRGVQMMEDRMTMLERTSVVKQEEKQLGADVTGEVHEKPLAESRSKRTEIREEERELSNAISEDEGYEPKIEASETTREKAENNLFGNQLKTGEETGKVREPKTISRVNKEVNTDITIATVLDVPTKSSLDGVHKTDQGNVEEFLINIISSKSKQKSPDRYKSDKHGYLEGKEPETVRSFGREDLAEKWKMESERIESKIELSKSDWELKMKKIAELENTTREKLNEMKSKSIVHRHRSLDRYDGREREKRKSPIPRIQVPEDDAENLEIRKKKISALSFDEITSRTEKLLGTNLNPDSTPHRKWRKSFDDDSSGEGGRSYEYYSSPTSPEYRGRKRSDYSSPKRYEGRWKLAQTGEEDWLTITEENGRGTRVDLVSPSKKSEKDQSPIGGFNPFPTKTQSRPKELGVRLGMYPASPEGSYPTKKSQ